jgi:Transposase DNA-binding
MRPPSVEFLVIVVCQGAEMDDARQWAEEQWSTCDLGDRRRTRRAVALGVKMAEHSDRSLPRQMAGMADLKAAYRLLDSEGATLEALTAPHRDRVRRAAGWSGDPVLFVQDQTCLDFSGHPATEGLGPIGNAGLENDFTRGFIAQTCLAVVAPPVGRRIIGLAALTVRTRDGIRKGTETKAQRQKRDNESGLWFGTLQGIGRPPEGALWISVGDRGSDIFHYFRQAADAGWHVLSRLCQDRLIEDLEAPGGPESLLFRLRNLEAMAQQSVPRREAGPAGSTCRSAGWRSGCWRRGLAPRARPWSAGWCGSGTRIWNGCC